MQRMLSIMLLIATAGCAGNEAMSFDGTVRGEAFVPVDVFSTNATIQTMAGPVDTAVILFTDAPDTCANASAGKELAGTRYFVISLSEFDVAGHLGLPAGTGDFGVYASGSNVPTKVAIVVSDTTDAQCQTIATAEAVGTAGTVTLTEINGRAYVGTFDMTLSPGDGQGNAIGGATESVSGSFQATQCDAVSVLVTNQTVTCL